MKFVAAAVLAVLGWALVWNAKHFYPPAIALALTGILVWVLVLKGEMRDGDWRRR